MYKLMEQLFSPLLISLAFYRPFMKINTSPVFKAELKIILSLMAYFIIIMASHVPANRHKMIRGTDSVTE